MPYNNEQRKHYRVAMNHLIFRRGGDELTPGSVSGPSIVYLYSS